MFNSVFSKLNFTVIRANSYKTTFRKCFMPTQLLAEDISRARHDFLLVLKEPYAFRSVIRRLRGEAKKTC